MDLIFMIPNSDREEIKKEDDLFSQGHHADHCFFIEYIKKVKPDYLVLTTFGVDPGETAHSTPKSDLSKIPGFIYGSTWDPNHPNVTEKGLEYECSSNSTLYVCPEMKDDYNYLRIMYCNGNLQIILFCCKLVKTQKIIFHKK